MEQGSRAGDSFSRRLTITLVVIVAAAHLLGLWVPHALWGADGFAFHSPLVALAATAALLVLVAPVLFGSARFGAAGVPAPAIDRTPGPEVWVTPLLAIAGALVFGCLHARHVLLGDGLALITSLPDEKALHPLEPLSMLLERAAYQVVAPLLNASSRDSQRDAWFSAAALSVLAGAVSLPVFWAIARRLSRRVPVSGAGGDARLAPILFLVLSSQGYLQVFFGYVEVYALPAAAIAVYLLAALRFLDERKRLWPAAIALAVAIALHLSALALVPSFAVLAWIAATRRETRPGLARDAVLCALSLAALPVSLALIGSGYDLGRTILSLVGTVFLRQPESIPGYLFSWRHAGDIVNEQLLIGPLTLPLFVPAAVAMLRGGGWRAPGNVFFLTLGGACALICLQAGDSNLGYARNWDLLAPAGVALTVAGWALLLPRFSSPDTARACTIALLAVSAYHLVPWVSVNASPERAVRRFAQLPLGLGRAESTLGYWYGLEGDTATAERWLARALDVNPGNVRAHVFIGDLYHGRGDHARACEAYRAAARLKPELDEYRLRMVDELVRAGRLEVALPEIERLLRRQPASARIWTVYGIVLLGAGRPAAARDAFANARRHAPTSLLYRLMLNYADLPGGYERALGEVWEALIRA